MSTKKERQGRAVEGDGNVHPIAIPPFDVGAPRIWVDEDDELTVGLRAAAGSVEYVLTARFLDVGGIVHDIQEVATPAISSNVGVFRHRLGPGWLLACSLHANANIVTGHTYAFLELVRHRAAGRFSVYQLAAGYITNISRLGWPFGRLKSSLAGPGLLVVSSPANPGAGNNLEVTVPTLMRWRLLSVFVTFTNDGSGSPLEPRVDIFRSSVRIARAQAGNTVALSTAAITTAFIGASDNQPSATLLQFPLFDLLLSEGDIIRITAGFLGAGDTITDAELISEQWFEEQS